MQKVCKVVFNSISHDARVLKEASAIRESGLDVTIIGIQDSNKNTPIEILENGIVIRRAAWTSGTVRPSALAYLFAISLTVIIGIVTTLFTMPIFTTLLNFIGSLTPYSIYSYILGLATIIVCILLIKKYKTKLSRFKKISTNESNLALKFDSTFDAHNFANNRTPNKSNQKIYKPQLPSLAPCRPLMGGLFCLFNNSTRKKWAAVFAREKSIYKILQDELPDIVHAHDLTALPVSSRYKSKYKTKLIFDAHEIYDHLAQASDAIASVNSKVLKKYSPYVDQFITINTSIAKYYKKFYKRLPAANIIKNATTLSSDFKYDGRLHDAAGLERNNKILIYQGGFAPNRGLINLLLASEFLNENWSIVFMGWGKLEDELKRIAKALKLKNPEIGKIIKFLPKVEHSELPYWTAGATIGIIPYENTGLNHWYCNPNKLWEYPNANVPILASPFPELKSYVEKYKIGWLLDDPMTPQNIAQIVNELDEEDIIKCKSQCRHFIHSDNWSIYAESLRKIYKKL